MMQTTIRRTAAVMVLMAAGATATGAAEIARSGFLEDYPELAPDGDRQGAMVWHKPGVDLGAYDKVAIDSIEIWYDPQAEHKGIDPDKLKTFTDAFRETIVEVLEPDYPVVSKAGAGVLRIRLAVTNVRVRKRGLRLYHIGVSGIGIGLMEAASGKSILVDKAVLEAELLDSQSGERLGVLVDPHPQLTDPSKATAESGASTGLKEQLVPGTEPSWPNLKKTMAFYAQRLRDRLDEAHGKQP